MHLIHYLLPDHIYIHKIIIFCQLQLARVHIYKDFEGLQKNFVICQFHFKKTPN